MTLLRVGNRDIDIHDEDAIRGLEPQEFHELLAAALAADASAGKDAEPAPQFPTRDVAAGSAIVLPTSRPRVP